MLAVPVVPGGLSQSCPLLLGAAVGAHTSPSLQPPSIQGSGLHFHPKGFLASDSPHRGHRPTSAQSFPCFWLNFWPIIVPTATPRSPGASRVEEGPSLTPRAGVANRSGPARPGSRPQEALCIPFPPLFSSLCLMGDHLERPSGPASWLQGGPGMRRTEWPLPSAAGSR